MARSSAKKSALRSLSALLALAIALVALVAGLHQWGGGPLTPRLGLDLEGGTEMVLAPVTESGAAVNPGQLDRAVEIIRQRIDANGVAESEISTQGGRNIVVAIPGTPSQDQLEAIRKPSQLRFRSVFVQDVETGTPPAGPATTPAPGGTTGTPAPTGTTAATPPPTTAANGVVPDALRATTAPTTPATPAGTATTTAPATAPATEAPAPPTDAQLEAAIASQASKGLLTLGWDQKKADAAAAKVAKEYVALNCHQPGAIDEVPDVKDAPMATCGEDGVSKYVLGPVEIDGSEIQDATSGYQPGPNGQPTSIVEVALSFKDAGKAKFAEVTRRLVGQQAQPPLDQFAVVLDKRVITAPQARAVITDGRASITGSFTLDSAKRLAQQLKFGALPMSFALQTNDTITPQLGEEQLRLGLLAGLIGLLLVVV
ncbi:MAG TPA: protein translocase subunit SecD, partial [Intrasporangium sp.]|nr:protein translocase subunit SecD [Intrasporangium sp.]